MSLFSLLTSYDAYATNRPGATTVTLAAGRYFFAQKRYLDNSNIPNIALAYNFNSTWAVEGSVGALNTNQKTRLGGNGVHGFLYTVDALYRFKPKGMFEPYVALGVGVLGLTPNANNSIQQGNMNASIGTQIFFADSIALRGEVKDVYTMSGGKNDYMLNFGVSILMGGVYGQPEVASFK